MAVLRFDEPKEARMRGFFESLSEKNQRQYAALQADQLEHGRIVYVAEELGCSVPTIGRDTDELDQSAAVVIGTRVSCLSNSCRVRSAAFGG